MISEMNGPRKQSRPPPDELNQLIALFGAARYVELEEYSLRLITQYPNSGLLWKLLAATLQMQGKDALDAFKEAVKLLPGDPEPLNSLGIILESRGRLGDASACYLRALEIDPRFVQAHCNLGNLLCEMGQLEQGVDCFRRALAIDSTCVEAHYNLGDALLALGRYPEGWREYEYRLNRTESRLARPPIALPQWRGQRPAPNQGLLVFEEQGLGDKIQFARYLDVAAERFSGRIGLVVCSPLYALFRRSFPQVAIFDDLPAELSQWHWQCPLLSLPLAFGTTLDTIPNKMPYLTADPTKASRWKQRIGSLQLKPSVLRIGIVWKPGATMKNAQLRSLSLQCLSPLLNRPDCAWISLQKEPDPDKAPWIASGRLIDWAGELADFDETAALSTNLDLVISVDTSVVHLAGALGLPVWLLNRHASEWRWMRGREDSPWYPTLRIFAQKSPGDWNEVVKRVADAINGMPRAER
jgi:tetratricopeptide (TPR) repeat protein